MKRKDYQLRKNIPSIETSNGQLAAINLGNAHHRRLKYSVMDQVTAAEKYPNELPVPQHQIHIKPPHLVNPSLILPINEAQKEESPVIMKEENPVRHKSRSSGVVDILSKIEEEESKRSLVHLHPVKYRRHSSRASTQSSHGTIRRESVNSFSTDSDSGMIPAPPNSRRSSSDFLTIKYSYSPPDYVAKSSQHVTKSFSASPENENILKSRKGSLHNKGEYPESSRRGSLRNSQEIHLPIRSSFHVEDFQSSQENLNANIDQNEERKELEHHHHHSSAQINEKFLAKLRKSFGLEGSNNNNDNPEVPESHVDNHRHGSAVGDGIHKRHESRAEIQTGEELLARLPAGSFSNPTEESFPILPEWKRLGLQHEKG